MMNPSTVYCRYALKFKDKNLLLHGQKCVKTLYLAQIHTVNLMCTTITAKNLKMQTNKSSNTVYQKLINNENKHCVQM